MKIFYSLTFLFFVLIVDGCAFDTAERSSIPTIDGPEATHLINKTKGYIIYDFPVGGIKATSLPNLKETTIKKEDVNDASIHSLSGPDKNGRIVFVENHMGFFKSEHFLKTISIDGTQENTVFRRAGDALWDDVIGEKLYLSSSNGYVAFVNKLQPQQMYKPDMYLKIGYLEILDINHKTNLDVNLALLKDSLSWFPGGSKLAYTKLITRQEILNTNYNSDEYLKYFANWPQVPAVYVYNLLDHTCTFLHLGWYPIVSPDGKSVIVSDHNYNTLLVDIETKKSKPINCPGIYGPIIAFIEPNLVLYWGLPTSGTTPQMTKNNSPLVGPKPMITIKLADFSTGQFQTVMSSIDPRSKISFGLANVEGFK